MKVSQVNKSQIRLLKYKSGLTCIWSGDHLERVRFGPGDDSSVEKCWRHIGFGILLLINASPLVSASNVHTLHVISVFPKIYASLTINTEYSFFFLGQSSEEPIQVVSRGIGSYNIFWKCRCSIAGIHK